MLTRRKTHTSEQKPVKKPHARQFDPMTLMKLVGTGVLALLLIAVGAGFRQEPLLETAARGLAYLGPLAEPVVFGLSVLELAGVCVAFVVLGLSLWRGLKR